MKIDILLAIEQIQQSGWYSYKSRKVTNTSRVDIETSKTSKLGLEVTNPGIALVKTYRTAPRSAEPKKHGVLDCCGDRHEIHW